MMIEMKKCPPCLAGSIASRALVPSSGAAKRGTSARSGFTLVELMISIALVLLLILGVNKIFTYTTQAVGAGEAINADIRASRAAQATFAGDLGSVVGSGSGPNDSACMILFSQAIYAFRSAKDKASQGPTASDNSLALPTAAFVDINGDGQFGDTAVNGEVVYPATYNFRNHRLDTLSFFARDTFHRQTGNPGTFVDNMASTEAWIWYGHLWLPDNSISYLTGPYPAGSAYAGATGPLTLPGASTAANNPNNYFASQFVLGRVGLLLTEKSLTATPTQPVNTIVDQSQNQQWFIDRAAGTTQTYGGDLTPLAANSTLNTSAVPTTSLDPGSTTTYLYNSRTDLVSTSIQNYRQKLSNFITLNPTNTSNSATWWWSYLVNGSNGRFQCNPFVAKPMQAVDVAHASPYFLSGCSQFIVEYAGDFLSQDSNPNDSVRTATAGLTPGHAKYGDVTGPGSDGQIDFYVAADGITKQIAWYGLPRSTSGNVKINVGNGDVVPLRDRFQVMWNNNIPYAGPYQNFPIPTALLAPMKAAGYPVFEEAGPDYQASDYSQNNMTATQAQNGYLCAFGPNDTNRPKLIRITMTLEDPTGRLPDGQTYQYVFPVP